MTHAQVQPHSGTVPEPAPTPTVIGVQRTLLAACILFAPLSITLYILAWPENPAPVVVNATTPAPIVTSAMAGAFGNTLHFNWWRRRLLLPAPGVPGYVAPRHAARAWTRHAFCGALARRLDSMVRIDRAG